MPIRPATFADLLPAAHVATKAFFDEDLFGRRIHPNRTSYPGDMYLFFLRELRQSFFDARTKVFVSHPKDLPSQVTGLAVWIRKGDGAKSLDAAQSYISWFTGTFLIPVWNRVESWIWPNRAADPTQLDVLERSMPFIKHHWEKVGYEQSWYLSLLGTGPEYQGHGYGKELLSWGFERAREEGIRVSLISAAGKDGFYRRLGVGEYVGDAGEGGKDNPLWDVEGGMILFSERFDKGS